LRFDAINATSLLGFFFGLILELGRVQAQIGKLIQAIKDGVPGSVVKTSSSIWRCNASNCRLAWRVRRGGRDRGVERTN
jgi:hypothetical protein